jgi:hypothetical protein
LARASGAMASTVSFSSSRTSTRAIDHSMSPASMRASSKRSSIIALSASMWPRIVPR